MVSGSVLFGEHAKSRSICWLFVAFRGLVCTLRRRCMNVPSACFFVAAS